jgi:hypothetical protein
MLRRRSALYPSGENSQAQGPHAAAAREAQMQA